MNEFIYTVFMFIVDAPIAIGIPINLWFWLLFAVAPLLVYFVDVERSARSHFFRVIVAVGVIYVLLNLSLATSHSFAWADYYACQENSIHPDMSPAMEAECRYHLEINSGAQNVFAFLFGWFQAGVYVGLWEGLWRFRHRREIKDMGCDYKGRLFSNLTMLMVQLFILLLLFGMPALLIVIGFFVS